MRAVYSISWAAVRRVPRACGTKPDPALSHGVSCAPTLPRRALQTARRHFADRAAHHMTALRRCRAGRAFSLCHANPKHLSENRAEAGEYRRLAGAGRTVVLVCAVEPVPSPPCATERSVACLYQIHVVLNAWLHCLPIVASRCSSIPVPVPTDQLP